MNNLRDLYQLASDNDIGIFCFDLGPIGACAIQDAAGKCYVAIDPMQLSTTAEEAYRVAHELGHCQTGSFYHKFTPLQTRERCEWRAEKLAMLQLLPLSDINRCVRQGYTEPWEISEQLDVPESLVRKALAYYQEQNLQERGVAP